ncbi:MAG: ABC transporter ATP-binding protein [Candidatus Bathyarchaeota archaeon]|nr:MAG: ABC transporter ATP-binding protein [Candidatus Bathyarchaeota archaeon]
MDSEEIELRVVDLKKWFPVRRGIFSSLLGRKTQHVKAVDGVSFNVRRGEIFGLAGESGCGKTTAGKTILRLLEPTGGEIYFQGQNITDIGKKDMKELRRKMQIIYQDPYESLNPRMTVYDIIAEPINIHGLASTPSEMEDLIYKSLDDVELAPPEDFITRFPHELSGGQRQRVAVARSLVMNPSFIVADEPISMLDVSIRAGLLKVMFKSREAKGDTYIFITHDLAYARHICDRGAIMYLGKIVELGTMDDLVKNPLHPYTIALMVAVPVPDPRLEKARAIIGGEVPTPIDPPPGCRFHPRCSRATERCRSELPQLVEIETGHFVACHNL